MNQKPVSCSAKAARWRWVLGLTSGVVVGLLAESVVQGGSVIALALAMGVFSGVRRSRPRRDPRHPRWTLLRAAVVAVLVGVACVAVVTHPATAALIDIVRQVLLDQPRRSRRGASR